MKTSDYYAANRIFQRTSKDSAKKLIEAVQIEALAWAAHQIVTDGNPDVARDKITQKIQELIAGESPAKPRANDSPTVLVELIHGVEGHCIAINSLRVCGPKPWGGGTLVASWWAKVENITEAIEPSLPPGQPSV